ncbi:uncharacterized protein EI97DRAFT_94622 [Westerdykella ornata]|uniref:Uncharacterized protein n=1 Tax=Westerdykella ornata TaxID=318751 RepID=A0A6A6JF53_WESOR|nr:uncharacterized protein EI97DRAFT_94622 [Westerdykella ornata]KAF2274618.1 hypothetical protein EI97DRAFT_94622 [Westerdykella ornata]
MSNGCGFPMHTKAQTIPCSRFLIHQHTTISKVNCCNCPKITRSRRAISGRQLCPFRLKRSLRGSEACHQGTVRLSAQMLKMLESQSPFLALFLANRGAKQQNGWRERELDGCMYIWEGRGRLRMFPLASSRQGNVQGFLLLFRFPCCFGLSPFLPFLWKSLEYSAALKST